MDQEYINIGKEFFGYLPELPPVAQNFIELIKTSASSRRSFANLMLIDPVLSTRVFSYINLVLPHADSEFISVNKGISVLGLHAFKNVIAAFALYPLYEDAGCIDLFKYSLLTAYCAQVVSSVSNLINPHDAYLIAFLQDIGKIAIKNKYGDLLPILPFDSDELQKELTLEEEISRFKCAHPAVSEFICSGWNLPHVICDSIKYHHNPLSAMIPQAASIIYIADIIAKKETKFTQESQKVFQFLQMSKTALVQQTVGWEKKLSPFFQILNI